MPGSIYVIGHKNPDSDSICSAVAYTALLHAQGQTQAVAARQGVLRPESAYILDRFGVAAPILLTDVRPRVADVMTTPVTTVNEDTSLFEVGQSLQRLGIRIMPVVDNTGHLTGVIGVEDFARYFIAGLDLDELDRVPLELDNVLSALGGRVLVEAPGRTLRDRVMVGAMQIDSMLKRLAPDIMMVMGDREDAQRAAIEFGVGALVITGDHPVSEEILAMAREREVTIISVPHHTYTTVRLIHMSVPVRHVMNRDPRTCGPDDLVEEVSERLRSGAARSLVVLKPDNTVMGFVSRSSLLRSARKQVVLVDHNERSQSVEGIEEADVVGVIDHHRVADFQTRVPPFMRLEPVGATSTIVGKLYLESGLPIPREMAGVLLGGILADTLVFRSATNTPEDERVARILAGRAGVDLEEFGNAILSTASDVSDRTAEQIVASDFKEFLANGSKFGIGTIETTSGAEVLSRREEILDELARLRAHEGYDSVIFAVIDIVHERTTLLVQGHTEALASTFDTSPADPHAVHLPGIVSRKKHIVPMLGTLARSISVR
ncbi:MAG: putative manganese-dependent inorganic diphosphatase [Chloroflexota bacterium]|nr:putative manganese-dependent inorganic diphosphatase [Chloroflexota bacterium]